MDFRKTIFKHLQFRLFSTGRRCTWMVMFIPTFSYAMYPQDCQWKHAVFVSWLNWSIGFVFHQHNVTVSS